MITGKIFLGIGILSAGFSIFYMMQIVNYLSCKGIKINWFLLRLKWFTYMLKYRELTIIETGSIGPYHKAYIISVLCTLVMFITGAVLLS